MLKAILLVGSGSFIGGAARYLVSTLMKGTGGGFTAFSTFANESLKMLQTGNTWGFIGYVAISVVVGIGLTALGYLIVK